jgi:hypothetical protein
MYKESAWHPLRYLRESKNKTRTNFFGTNERLYDCTDDVLGDTRRDDGRGELRAAGVAAGSDESRGGRDLRQDDRELSQELVHAVQLLLTQPRAAQVQRRTQRRGVALLHSAHIHVS